MKIGVACSGLGHVQRGIESWAKALAEGLHREGQDVVLYHGGGQFECENVQLDFAKRGDGLPRRLERYAPGFTRRGGWKSAYAYEQRSFARALIAGLKQSGCDVVHTQDPVVADELEKACRAGKISCPAILGHGTNEDTGYLERFRYLQHISPAHEAVARDALGDRVRHFCIPNFIDTDLFSPRPDRAWRTECRQKLGVPEDRFVIGCAGVLASTIKRMDSLIPEVAGIQNVRRDAYLLLAGAATGETPAIRAEAARSLGDQCRILEDLPFEDMPDFYGALDLLVLPCCIETFGIVLLESMAMGVPVVAHDSPTLKWVVGNGGWCTPVDCPGFLQESWPMIEACYESRRKECRGHVQRMFSWRAVYPQLSAMYRDVVAVPRS